MKIAIFGSCVSRDTCEFIPDAEVKTYVARQSVTSLNTPHGEGGVDISGLHSSFQRRMVTSDLRGDGLSRIAKNVEDLDLILIDLVDERRGYWLWPDGTTMTNSLEIEACGAGAVAEEQGARLVEFGTEEHFAAWKHGFAIFIEGLRKSYLWDRTVLLDIEWASALEGAQHPQGDLVSQLGRQWRKLQRGTREATRSMSSGGSLMQALGQLRTVKPTEAEEFADRAKQANGDYIRYRKVAADAAAAVVTRASNEVRIGRDHKWGPEPFHYRDEDYFSIVSEIEALMMNRGRLEGG